jgi:hypothetical protein
MRAGAERAEVTVEQVVRELKLLGFSDIRMRACGTDEFIVPIGSGGVKRDVDRRASANASPQHSR